VFAALRDLGGSVSGAGVPEDDQAGGEQTEREAWRATSSSTVEVRSVVTSGRPYGHQVSADTDLRSRKRPGSRVLHLVNRIAARPAMALTAVSLDLVWMLYSAVVGFPARLESVFQTLVAAMTLAMVFVIQHTQSRQQTATQRKLDEILAALPQADNTLVSLEDADDQTLAAAHTSHRRIRRQAVRDNQDTRPDPSRAAPG
jgi:low affinity Fe/Cu permease